MRYAAFLRAINVGKHNRLKMADLKSVLGALGYSDCQTYLQSGNAVFSAQGSAPQVATEIEQALRKFGLEKVFVMVRSATELQALLERLNMALLPGQRSYVAFLREPASLQLPQVPGCTWLSLAPSEVCYAGESVGAVAPLLEKLARVPATVRYGHVVEKVYDLMR